MTLRLRLLHTPKNVGTRGPFSTSSAGWRVTDLSTSRFPLILGLPPSLPFVRDDSAFAVDVAFPPLRPKATAW